MLIKFPKILHVAQHNKQLWVISNLGDFRQFQWANNTSRRLTTRFNGYQQPGGLVAIPWTHSSPGGIRDSVSH